MRASIRLEQARKDADAEKNSVAKAYLATGAALARLYGPSIAVGALSITGILAGNNVLRRRNVALAAAYATVDQSYRAYRGRVAREMNIPESTLRSLLNERSAARTSAAQTTADFLRQQVAEKGMIDVGTGVDRELGISREKMTQALGSLKKEGYEVYGGGVEQVTNPGKQTHLMVLCPPGTPHKDIYELDKIHTITDYKCREDEDGTERFEKGFEYPASMDSKRLLIRYRDDPLPDGHPAVEKDGTIEIRRGVPDLDLGSSHYAQVRILVDGDKYIKGMAHYSDDLPDGVDVAFNTNKTPGQEALKPIKKTDPSNPFGALLREEGGQYHYIDENGERKLGLINKTRQEGDWGEWADKLPSQFLSKQSMQLIHKQLDMSIADKYSEFEEICQLTNPTVKKHLLESFANDCDSCRTLPHSQNSFLVEMAKSEELDLGALCAALAWHLSLGLHAAQRSNGDSEG